MVRNTASGPVVASTSISSLAGSSQRFFFGLLRTAIGASFVMRFDVEELVTGSTPLAGVTLTIPFGRTHIETHATKDCLSEAKFRHDISRGESAIEPATVCQPVTGFSFQSDMTSPIGTEFISSGVQ